TTFLNTLGIEVPVVKKANATTVQAIKKFEKLIGAEPTGCFSPKQLLMLHAETVTLGEILPVVGFSVEDAGNVLSSGQVSVIGAELKQGGFSGPEGDYVAEAQNGTFPVTFGGSEWKISLEDLQQFG